MLRRRSELEKFLAVAEAGKIVTAADRLVDRRADSTPIGTLTCWIRAIMRGQHSTPVNTQTTKRMEPFGSTTIMRADSSFRIS